MTTTGMTIPTTTTTTMTDDSDDDGFDDPEELSHDERGDAEAAA